jgi:beta-glucosidase
MTTTALEPAPIGAFPTDFRFGVAMASYQIEGAVSEDGRGPSIWDTFCRRPGAVAGGDTGDVACDHYHRWREDLDLMASLGVESYRFSIAWPRVQPDGRGALNRAGVDWYRRLCEGLRERGIEAVATLYHWDLPQARQDAGGWAARDTAERFAEYAALMAAELGDVVDAWITHNEPWVVAFLGHAEGTKAPGVRDWPTALRASHHLLLSHGLAVAALRAGSPGVPVGLTLNLAPVRAASSTGEDREAAVRMDGYYNRWFLDPVLRGSYPEDMVGHYEARYGPLDVVQDGDLAVISRPIDFLGINYYSRHTVAGPADGVFADPSVVSVRPGSERVQMVDTGAPKTQMGWEVHPDGLIDVVAMAHARAPQLPLFITENGAAYPDHLDPDGTVNDEDRRHYFQQHTAACADALARGLPVKGYFAWSLMDNFEWAFGFSRRFGLVYVDYDTQQRTVKASGWWFRDFLRGDHPPGGTVQ